MANPATLAIGPFYWLGGAPGQRLVIPLGSAARHSRANAAGIKAKRNALRRVPMGRFTRMDTMEQVAMAMFIGDHGRLLREHLLSRGIEPESIAIPDRLRWEDSAEFAHLIDGYELARAAGLGDPTAYQESGRAAAETAGEWRGTALELWILLFLEHRRDHFGGFLSGCDTEVAPPPLLDELCTSLLASLA